MGKSDFNGTWTSQSTFPRFFWCSHLSQGPTDTTALFATVVAWAAEYHGIHSNKWFFLSISVSPHNQRRMVFHGFCDGFPCTSRFGGLCFQKILGSYWILFIYTQNEWVSYGIMRMRISTQSWKVPGADGLIHCRKKGVSENVVHPRTWPYFSRDG